MEKANEIEAKARTKGGGVEGETARLVTRLERLEIYAKKFPVPVLSGEMQYNHPLFIPGTLEHVLQQFGVSDKGVVPMQNGLSFEAFGAKLTEIAEQTLFVGTAVCETLHAGNENRQIFEVFTDPNSPMFHFTKISTQAEFFTLYALTKNLRPAGSTAVPARRDPATASLRARSSGAADHHVPSERGHLCAARRRDARFRPGPRPRAETEVSMLESYRAQVDDTKLGVAGTPEHLPARVRPSDQRRSVAGRARLWAARAACVHRSPSRSRTASLPPWRGWRRGRGRAKHRRGRGDLYWLRPHYWAAQGRRSSFAPASTALSGGGPAGRRAGGEASVAHAAVVRRALAARAVCVAVSRAPAKRTS